MMYTDWLTHIYSLSTDYTTDKVTNILNSELANTLGNLLSRCTSKTVNPAQHFPGFDSDLFKQTSSSHDLDMMEQLSHLPGLSVF